MLATGITGTRGTKDWVCSMRRSIDGHCVHVDDQQQESYQIWQAIPPTRRPEAGPGLGRHPAGRCWHRLAAPGRLARPGETAGPPGPAASWRLCKYGPYGSESC
jgi:hypothetical protein